MDKGSFGGEASVLKIDTTTQIDKQHPSIISPVSPAPESIDQSKLNEDIRSFLLTHTTKDPPLPSKEVLKQRRENKAEFTLIRCLTEYRRYSDAWRKKNESRGYCHLEHCGVLEGAIAAGKTTFAALMAKALEKHGFIVCHRDEKVPAKSLQKYYLERAKLDPSGDNPIHIPIASQIQFYIMTNRISMVAEASIAEATIHLQDRFFGDLHFMMCNIRDGITTDEEVETYVSLWSGTCAALPMPSFVLIMEPDADTIVANNRARMENLRITSAKILSVLFRTDTSIEDRVSMAEQMFPSITNAWKLEVSHCKNRWEDYVIRAIELRERNGENTLNEEWLKQHAKDYLKTLQIVEGWLQDRIQFIHVPYSAPKFPDVDKVIAQINVLRDKKRC